MVLNCSRVKFQQNINEIGHLLMVFSENAGGGGGRSDVCFKYGNFVIIFHGLKLFFTAVMLLKFFTGGN